MSEKKEPYVRKILDDLFDAFTLLGQGSYVFLYDVVGQMTRYTPAAVDLFGLPGEYIPAGAYNWSDYVHPEDRARYEKIMNAMLKSNSMGYDLTYRVKLKDSSYSSFRFLGAVLRDEDGKPELIGGLIINEKMTETTDPVTVLRNKYGFFQDLNAAIELKKNCIILLCGINRLSTVNNEHGYTFGNMVLRQTGWLLQEIVEQSGTVYRMDGAKFAFLTETLSPEEVAYKYEKLRRTAQAGLPVNNVRQTLSFNGGMISFGGGNVDEHTIYSCLLFAYEDSKFYHNGKLVNYNGALGLSMHNSLEMLDEVRNCIVMDCKNFSLRYQPIFDAKTERLTSVEALLCWHSERFGEVSPSAYVPVLENDFVFEELGYWILRRAMEDGLKLLAINPNLMLNVNISPAQIVDDFLSEELDKISKSLGFPLKSLCFELTQSCRLIEPDILRRMVRALKRKGIRCLIDDFGSGVASIDFLRDLAPDFIKLERDYILHIKDKPGNLQIVKHLSELAADLGTKVCLKGVEDAEIRKITKDFPVTNLQGNYYSAAITLDEVIKKFL